MRALSAGLFVAVFGAGLLAGTTLSGLDQGPRAAVDAQCGAASKPHVRTTLYFGLGRPNGSVSELEWQMFLRDDVTSRFPDGLTVWEAEGQWKMASGGTGHERSKVLLLVHPDTAAARESLKAVIDRYRKNFEQETVLWETARVCAAI